MAEDKRAFPYRPPSYKLKERYKDIFSLTEPLKERPCKLIFDKSVSAIIILLTLPIFVIIFIAYFLDGLIYSEDRGCIFASYNASSYGRRFKKYKFRLIKRSLIDNDLRKKGDYHAYASERNPANVSCV